MRVVKTFIDTMRITFIRRMGCSLFVLIFLGCTHLNPPTERKPSQVSGPQLMDPKNNTEYNVLFTDPLCRRYSYTKPFSSRSGRSLGSKPKNIYCRNKFDLATSGNRPESPQYQLVKLVESKDTREIIFTYLSFRNKAVRTALCERLKSNDPIRVTFVMSSSEDTAAAEEVIACNPKYAQFKTRGLEGDLGYAHNKIFVALQKPIDIDQSNWMSQVGPGERITIVFSSGNMTSGPVLHHENWHFITTDAGTHFAKIHMCVLQSEWNDNTGRTRNAYMKAIRDCRQNLVQQGLLQEQDVRAFFVPGEGQNQYENMSLLDNGSEGESASNYMAYGDGYHPGIRNADKIWIGAHRFFYARMLKELKKRMLSSKKPEMRIILDDDTYYKATDPNFSAGDTDPGEWYNAEELMQNGAQVRLMETNDEEHQLHHSKYLLFFKGNEPKGLLCGAANLTGSGFTKNWENIYYVTVPHILDEFKNHYEKFWVEAIPSDKISFESKATPVELLPQRGSVSDVLDQEGE
ncbi:MAG: hypothetical protein H6623_05250 [Bdellovibrionaceae bacterium]|nr:hypothetical protein [Pseudobdellovibrionaceae bacterium]